MKHPVRPLSALLIACLLLSLLSGCGSSKAEEASAAVESSASSSGTVCIPRPLSPSFSSIASGESTSGAVLDGDDAPRGQYIDFEVELLESSPAFLEALAGLGEAQRIKLYDQRNFYAIGDYLLYCMSETGFGPAQIVVEAPDGELRVLATLSRMVSFVGITKEKTLLLETTALAYWDDGDLEYHSLNLSDGSYKRLYPDQSFRFHPGRNDTLYYETPLLIADTHFESASVNFDVPYQSADYDSAYYCLSGGLLYYQDKGQLKTLSILTGNVKSLGKLTERFLHIVDSKYIITKETIMDMKFNPLAKVSLTSPHFLNATAEGCYYLDNKHLCFMGFSGEQAVLAPDFLNTFSLDDSVFVRGDLVYIGTKDHNNSDMTSFVYWKMDLRSGDVERLAFFTP